MTPPAVPVTYLDTAGSVPLSISFSYLPAKGKTLPTLATSEGSLGAMVRSATKNHQAGLAPGKPMLTATGPQGHTRQGKWISSSRRDPCPCCSRQHDGSCRIGTDLTLCWRGSSHNPPTWARRPGDHGPGADGGEWAYVGDRDGWAMFKPHRPLGREERRRLPKRTVPVTLRPSWADDKWPPMTVRPSWADEGAVEAFWMEEPGAGRYRPSNWIVASLYLDHCLAMGWEVVL